jgi:hypothetical protein
MSKVLVDLLGWAGALLLLGAYGCVSFKKLRPESIVYQVINGLGSCCLVVNTMFYRAYPSAFVNVIWIAIALTAGMRAKAQAQGAVRVDG